MVAETKYSDPRFLAERSAPSRDSAEERNGFNRAIREFAAAILRDLPPSLYQFQKTSAASQAENLVKSESPSIGDRYRVLVEQIPAVIFMAYLEDGISEAYVSPQIERMLGFSQEEWLDDPVRWYQQIHPEDRERWSVEAAESFITGKPLKSVYRVLARDGRVVWFHCEAKLVRKPDGGPWFIHGVGFDVTDLKETEEALRRESTERERLQTLELERHLARVEQTESRLAAIVESSEDAIIGKELDGTITSWNAAATRLFGYQPEEAIGKPIQLVIPPDLREEEMEILRGLRAGLPAVHRETQRVTKEARRLDVSLTVSPVKDAAGHVIGWSSIARDITERKAAQERMRITEKLAATGRLAATISHEINNPLEAIMNLVYIAESEPSLPPKILKLLESVDRELQRVVHIARQTLGFYRDPAIPTKVDIPKLIEDVVGIYRSKLSSKGLEVITQFDPECEMFGLMGEIRQVVSNLVSNAIDASSPGGRIVVKAGRSRNWKADEPGIRVSIGDNGSGIPSDIQARIFEPFYSTKQDVGTGLGLWLSKSLIEKHRGTIRFRSCVEHVRRGTVFSVFLPCDKLSP